ncbi:MAG: Maf family protein [Aestuariivirga sp.]|nr:Maf family protein [Aestuariivirga sp.]
MIILASTSPTRQALLRNAGLEFTAVAPRVNEREIASRHPGLAPSGVAQVLAEAKAIEVSRRFPQAIVIGADQVLALGSRIFAKPSSRDECREHLIALRGRTHALISSVVCAEDGVAGWSHTAEAFLAVRSFSDRFLENYLDAVGEDCTASVGGYKIESLGIQLFEEVTGDHTTILGLPLLPLLDHLRRVRELST